MPTPVILYIFTFFFIFLWPFGVNILESVCLLLSNLVLYFWDELNISKNVTEIQSTLNPYENNIIYIYCPSRGLLGYPPCVEKSSLQIQQYVLLLEGNMIPEKSYLCFFT